MKKNLKEYVIVFIVIVGLILLIPGLNLSFLPLANFGFGWVLPTILAIVIGLFIFKETSDTNIKTAAYSEILKQMQKKYIKKMQKMYIRFIRTILGGQVILYLGIRFFCSVKKSF